MTETSHDLLVIGGGINGAAVARDAAGRGLSVVLCEKDDLAAHTSSASTKLIHGGLRYLEQGKVRLVREALRERETLMDIAPHLVRPQDFILPHRYFLRGDGGLRPGWMLRLGVLAYDVLAGGGSLPGSRGLKLKDGPLKPEYGRGLRYSDCRVDDARLTVLTAMDAQDRGADIRPRTECIALERGPESWRAILRGADGATSDVQVRAVVNAAGAWAGAMAARFADDGADAAEDAASRKEKKKTAKTRAEPPRVRLVKGSHIVTRRLYEGDHAYIFQNPDRRIVFAIPYQDRFTLIGTTDTPVDTPEQGAAISEEETDYLLRAVSAYFAQPVSREDIAWTFAGVRALQEAPEKKSRDKSGEVNPSRLSRDDALLLDVEGAPILSIVGGKLTTHRRVAERVLETLKPHLKLTWRRRRTYKEWTADAVLPGGNLGLDAPAFETKLAAEYKWAPEPMLRRLARAYGTRARNVLGAAKSDAELGVYFGADLYERELRYMIEHEFARTGEDALWRRSKLGLALSEAERRAVDEWMRNA